jgi:hypothetical protein
MTAVSGEGPMNRLSDDQVTFDHVGGGIVAVGAHEIGGRIYYSRFDLFDFPNDLVITENLKRAILERVDVVAVGQHEAAGAANRPATADARKRN